MGMLSSFCSYVKEKASSAYNGFKNTAKKVYNVGKTIVNEVVEGAKTLGRGINNVVNTVVEKAKDAGRAIKDGVTKVFAPVIKKVEDTWAKFTGRKTYEEAKERYNKLVAKYNEKSNAYKTKVASYAATIKQIVESINAEKQYVINTLFVRMKNVLSKIKYDNNYALEYFKLPETKVEALRKSDDLFLIDFDRDPIKTTFQAVFSLGIWTRKKARETLDRIIEEEKKAEEIYSKMDADLDRLELLKTALMQTLTYLKDMSAMYENVVYKANNSAKYLRFKCMQFTHGVSKEYCKLEALPKADRELMFALFNFTKILDDIVKMELVGQDTDEIKRYEMKLQKCQFDFNKTRETIAA